MKKVANIDLTPERNAWRKAIYGREVRAANDSAFAKIETSVNDTVQNVNEAAKEALNATELANAASEAAEASAKASEAAAKQAINAAADSADKAIAAANKTIGASNEALAEAQSILDDAEAWAHGHADHPDRSMDNSKYYSEVSRNAANEAENSAKLAEQYAQIRAPGFYFDIPSAMLYIKQGVGVLFDVVDNVLVWKVV